MERRPLVIKKYENRRLYDTANSRYINLDEVAQMVQQGRDLQVVDAATGEDITRLVLTQIIVEQAKSPGSAFPLDILRQMVAATGRVSQETALNYMKTMFDMYQNAYRSMPLNPFGFMQSAPRPPDVEASPAPPESVGQDRSEENAELRRRVEELEAVVAKLGAKKAGGRRKPISRRKH